MAGAGGYDYEFVTAPPDRLICKICHNPCRDAHLTSCCGAHYCRSCLQLVRRGRSVNRSCPMCRTDGFNTFPNKEANREIKALHVYCLNSRNGCTWSGEVNVVKRHVNNDCQFVDVPCPSKCGIMLKRQCVQSHLNKDCPRHCQYCGFTGSKMEIAAQHKKNCAQYPLPCPNGCELGVIPSAGIASHKKVCPLEIIKCEYHGIGCNVKLPRKDLENHHKTETALHLEMMNRAFATMTKDLSWKCQSLEETQDIQYIKLTNMLVDSDNKLDTVSAEVDIAKESQLEQKENFEMFKQQFDKSVELIGSKLFYPFWILLALIAALLILFLYINVTLKESNNVLWRLSLQQGSHLQMSVNGIAPVIMKMSNYTKKMNHKEQWYSNPFLTFKGGHQIRLRVNTFGDGYYVIAALQLLPGPYDDELQRKGLFPLKMLATMELLNQNNNYKHHLVPVMVDSFSCSDCVGRVKENPHPRGFAISLISHSAVANRDSFYLHNDEIIFRVSMMEQSPYTTVLYYYYYFIGYRNWRGEAIVSGAVLFVLMLVMFLLIIYYDNDPNYNNEWNQRCLFKNYEGTMILESFHIFEFNCGILRFFVHLLIFSCIMFILVIFWHHLIL